MRFEPPRSKRWCQECGVASLEDACWMCGAPYASLISPTWTGPVERDVNSRGISAEGLQAEIILPSTINVGGVDPGPDPPPGSPTMRVVADIAAALGRHGRSR